VKHVFLPDENILMRALKCHKPAREFWETVALNCHRIAVDVEWVRKCWQRLHEERDSVNSHFPNIARIIGSLLKDPKKCDFRTEVKAVPEEALVRHANDKYLLRIVAAGNDGGLLVTTDRKTRNDFNRAAIRGKYKTRGLTIEEALLLAKQT